MSVFAKGQEVNINYFLKGEDITPAVYQALKECRKIKAKKLIFPKGKYEFWPTLASEKYIFTSNNDEGLKRIVFDLSEMKNLEIDGQGSSFIFHGYVSPFLLEDSKNISFKNFSIDYSRTFHSEGKILAVYKDSLDVWFSPSYPFMVNNYRLEFIDENKTLYPFSNLLEFDCVKREVASTAIDYIGYENVISRDLGKGIVRLYIKNIKGIPDNILTFNAKKRLNSAFAISKSQNISFSDISIYHAGGMGIVGQLSKNISLNKVKVTPSPNSDRIISLTSDATHFINCSGNISMVDCLFENQLDDATNIHGIYVKIEEIISSNIVLVKLSHSQQVGVEFLFPKTEIEITDAQSLMPYNIDNTIKSVEKINKEYTLITLNKSLPQETKVGDVIAAIDKYPKVLIKGCIIRNNRARGVLLGSRNKIVVEDNYFHNQASAILLEGDGTKWFEQSGVRDLVIRNNTFDNCNYTPWGSGVITVMSGIALSKRAESKYNQNILIENNLFHLCAPNILYMYCIDGIIYRNNKFSNDNIYKVFSKIIEPFVIENSTNINIEN